MTFKDPIFLFLVPFVLVISFYIKSHTNPPTIRFSTERFINFLPSTLKVRLSRNIIFMRSICLLLICFALARPQHILGESKIETEGIDIVLAIDVSTSMLAEDFQLGGRRRNRLDVVKDVVRDFIKGRKGDRIGMVAFAGRPYTVCPLTLDYNWLLMNLERVKIGMVEDGTAIGSGLSSAINRLKDTKSKSKIVILLTDGRNNAGKISPMTAGEVAKALGVKVYTIGAGSIGPVPYPVKDFFGRTVYQYINIDLDEETLKKIAQKTEGRYYRATDTTSLKAIYREIDKLEKTPIEEKGFMEYQERFYLFLLPGLGLLILEIILSNTILRRIP